MKKNKTPPPTTWRQYQRQLRSRRKRKAKLRLKQIPWQLYVLELENDHWYVGITRNFEQRYKKHCEGTGARWTKKHPPIRVFELRNLGTITGAAATRIEDTRTLELVSAKGEETVRGGKWCNVIYPNYPKN